MPGVLAGHRYCDNPVVNSVLSAKSAVMEEQGIAFQHRIALPGQLAVEGPDLCAMLGNGLDNAIEACSRLPEGERNIHLELRADRGLLVCRIANPCREAMTLRDGLPVTSKSSGHGYGLWSVREAAERYGGAMRVACERGTFVLLFYLPLPQER